MIKRAILTDCNRTFNLLLHSLSPGNSSCNDVILILGRNHVTCGQLKQTLSVVFSLSMYHLIV